MDLTGSSRYCEFEEEDPAVEKLPLLNSVAMFLEQGCFCVEYKQG